MKELLSPRLSDLRDECVLVQAWKKTAAYIRQHNWYADTLELDYQALRLPDFLGELMERLQTPESWASTPLEMVPAPKSQSWELRGEVWKPKESVSKNIRPLAHVALPDQVLATAMLLCLSDRAETAMGDPLLPIDLLENRRKVSAYGHRLFCDSSGSLLHHRWGSSKLYRLYFRDFQNFLRRPEFVANLYLQEARVQSREVVIVQSDLSKFYDRVRPALLHEKVLRMAGPIESDFFGLFQRIFSWGWTDENRAKDYGLRHEIPDFQSVALPQGLVASGFFANIALFDFGVALKGQCDQAIDPEEKLILKDVCYYVDDLRLVFLSKRGIAEADIQDLVGAWLEKLLNENAHGLMVQKAKTKATVLNRQERFLVQQSKTAQRIQRDVSGVFDMLHGTELIGAIEGFFHTQKRYSSQPTDDDKGPVGLIMGTSDMRDDTAARFAAGKFRRTFRSLRPLLHDETELSEHSGTDESMEEAPEHRRNRMVLSKEQLDDRGQLFAATLIEEWVRDPGNVRLMRIALDLYPDVRFLDKILKLLEPGWKEGGSRGGNREVRLYCLSEIFRAGVTETGMVNDEDCLPSGLNLDEYHSRLRKEATDIILAGADSPSAKKRFPWYLLQQVFLYLAAQNQIPEQISAPLKSNRRELLLHQRYAQFIAGKVPRLLQERAIFLILARSAFGHQNMPQLTPSNLLSAEFLHKTCEISPETAQAVWDQIKESPNPSQLQAARSLGLESIPSGQTTQSIAELVLQEYNPFWQEDNLLALAQRLLEISPDQWPQVMSPWQIQCRVDSTEGSLFGQLDRYSVTISGSASRAAYLFTTPSWCETNEERWRFQLGMILRFALRGSVDFYSSLSKSRNVTFRRYRIPQSHWERQRYATFQGRSAFGPAWIPISSWVEDFLFDLVYWPGTRTSSQSRSLSDWQILLNARLDELTKLHGPASKLCFLEQTASWPDKPPKSTWERPLRVGVVQSVIPNIDDYLAHLADPQFSTSPGIRMRQRRHLASIMEAVEQMLEVRQTHRSQLRTDGQSLDLLIFPELAVHPNDIEYLIMPFIRIHKCMVLFGQVYHPLSDASNAPLINSCLWLIPEWNPRRGFQVRRIEQGKGHLMRVETSAGFNPQPIAFRPAQWIIHYQWNSNPASRPLKMSASVCFDATDLGLASDLKSRNDLYIVPALNQDVGTFDRMAEGLHYHMFQGVIVVNNGQFGGSSFYMPFGESYHRQVFHLHGQPQASIAFAEIDPRKLINRPQVDDHIDPIGRWKAPPANWQSF